MANVYTNEAAITARVGAVRLLTLLDRDRNGVADTSVLDAAIERAGRIINRSLRQRYGSAIPFAQIGDSTPTPEEIQKVAEDLALWDLYSYWEPSGRDAEYHHALATEALEGLRKGEQDIAVARAKAHEGAVVAVFEAEDPTFAGTDSDGVSRIRGI